MALAPSKLGRFVDRHGITPESMIRMLREAGIVEPDCSDDAIRAALIRAREEHDALPAWQQDFNSPEERVRVFLEPCLSEKGRRWAEPIESLRLPDD